MNTTNTEAQGPSGPRNGGLSIGELAERTGLSTATIRMWESRHGFPRPERLQSGHRRYAETDVTALAHAVRRRDAGVRVDAAIAEARAGLRPASPSVFAELKRRHPGLGVQRLRKPTLLALSWAIEDEFCVRAHRAHVFGAFQHERRYLASEQRWAELARAAGSAFVFADFPSGTASRTGPVRVHLGADAPMRREWAVVCDSADLPVALTAWELPGQDDVPERDRIFEACWTAEPGAVRDASRVCAHIAHEAGAPGAAPLARELDQEPVRGATDLAALTTLFNRVLGYVDRSALASRPPPA